MAARGRCPECGSGSLVEDAHYAQQQLVCAACGCVLAEGLLTTTYTDEEHLREVAYSQSTGQKEQLSRCLQRGIRRVQDLCKVLQLPAVFEETAVSYFQRALQLPAFHLASLEKKELLGGCCVFVTCRQHSWPLTMGTVCSLLYARHELFASVFLSLQKELGLSVPALSLADLVTTHLNSFRLFQPSADVPAPFLEDKEKLLARTLGVVELASEAWLVTGRHPVPMVTAAAFLAWQSLRPGPRLCCPLSRFCRLAGLDVPPPAHLRLRELLDILLAMASRLPWLRAFRLDKKTVVKHLEELLQHRVFLLRSAFSQHGGEEEQQQQQQTDPGQRGEEQQQQDTAPGLGGEEQQQHTAPGQGSPGQEQVSPGSPGKDCPNKESPNKESPNKDFLNKESPNKDCPNKDCLGQEHVGLGSPNKDSPNKDSLDKDSPNKDSPGQEHVGPGSLDKDSLDKDSPNKDCPNKDPPYMDSPKKDSPVRGSPSSGLAQERGCPRAGRHPGHPRRPLLPPCLLHPRKRPRPAAPSAPAPPITGNEPISDSEIEQYLRSPQEIQALRRAQAWL